MLGKLNRDAKVAYEIMPLGTQYKIGDIIVFNRDGVNIIHMVEDIKTSNDEIFYKTKGINNKDNVSNIEDFPVLFFQIKIIKLLNFKALSSKTFYKSKIFCFLSIYIIIMSPTIQFRKKVNDYITSGVMMGYVIFDLKCSFCNNRFIFEFIFKRSSEIYCDNCKKKAYKLIYHNDSHITLRRYFNKKFKDIELKKKNIQNFVKRQHEFPEMYLKNFCLINSKKICIYNKKHDKCIERNIKSFSRKVFLYDEEIPQTTELFLSSIENEISPYLSTIIKTNKIFQQKDSIEDKHYKQTLLLRFIISLYLRRRIIKKIIYEKLKELESKEGRTVEIFDLKFEGNFIEQDAKGKRIYNKLVQQTHRNLIRSTILQEKMYKNYTIQLLINKTSKPFITSDNPIIN